MASPTLITRDNFTANLVRSTNARGATPDGNVYFDTTNDRIQLITYAELNQVNLGSGLEDNPLTATTKIQALALYFFILQEVEADSTLQGFRRSMDAVGNRMGKLVGATSFLNSVKLAEGTINVSGEGGELGDDRLKIADSGATEFDVNNNTDRVYHGAKSQSPINATTQPYYLLAASLSESDRQAATPVDFSKLGDINEMIQTFGDTANGDTNAGDFDSRTSILILCAREFGYTIGEANSNAAGVSELGAYLQGYAVGNTIAPAIDALSYTDVWTTPIAPYNAMSFYRHATPQTRSGFATSGAGASGDFTDEIQLSSGTMSITELRAWLDALMLQDTDENANTGATGAFRPKRAEPLYTIDPATAKLVTRAGIYVDPAKLTAEAQQQIIQTNDSGGQHFIPFNSGIKIAVSQAWKDDTSPWFRIGYVDAAGGNDFDTANFLTANDASAVALAGDDLDSRITGLELNFSYAYDTETAGGNVTAGVDQSMVAQFGGVDNSKTRTVFFTITASTEILVNAETELETN